MPNDVESPGYPDLRTTPVLIGIDVGSTTVKAAVVDPETRQIIWSDYQRHQTKQAEKVAELLTQIGQDFPRLPPGSIRCFITGSGAGPLAGPSVIAGALADLAVGSAIAFRPTTRYGLYGAIGLTLFYVVAGSILLPRLWLEPLGPLLKIWPILALNLILLAILEER